MFLSKSSNGIWYVYYEGWDGKTKRKSTRCKQKSDALKFLQTFKIEKEVKPRKTTLDDFTKTFLSYARTNFSKGTVGLYEATLKRLLSFTGNLALCSYTPQHWDLYNSERLQPNENGTTLSAVTANIELRTLRAAFNTAFRWKLIDSNPFSCQKLCRVEEQSPIFFTREDFQKLISIVKDPWLKEIVIIAVLTGMRRGEILNLKWSNVDLKRNVIMIQSNPTFKTKTGKRRCIPLNETASYLLRQKSVLPQSEYVFTLNGKQIRDGWVTHKFKFYVYECRFQDDRLHFHSLRHTFASWLVQDGVSLYEVQKLLGHTDMKVTQIYSHLQPEQLHDTVNRIHIHVN